MVPCSCLEGEHSRQWDRKYKGPGDHQGVQWVRGRMERKVREVTVTRSCGALWGSARIWGLLRVQWDPREDKGGK